MAEASTSSSSVASTSAASVEEEPLHLLVLAVDASDVYAHSYSLEEPAKRVTVGKVSK